MRADERAAKKKADPSPGGSIELEETNRVQVECLATAFRALKSEEGGGRKRKGKGKGKKGRRK